MKLKASEIAKACSAELSGTDAEITGAAPLEKAGPGDLAFIDNVEKSADAGASSAGCLIAPLEAKGKLSSYKGAVIFAQRPRLAFTVFLRAFETEIRPSQTEGIHPAAVISPEAKVSPAARVGPCAVIEAGARIEDNSAIGANCYIGANARVGKGTRLYPGAVLMDSCEIGERCIIHPGAVIGADGYGYMNISGKHEKIPQIGKVIIGDDVEIGANATIDRAALDATIIGSGTKIDNMVHVAHNVRVGKNCLLIAQAGIAGSTEIGDNVIIAGQAGISDHIKIGNNSVVMAKTGIMADLPPGQIVFGHVGRPRMQAMKIEALLSKLPEMHATIRKLKKRVGLDESEKNDK